MEILFTFRMSRGCILGVRVLMILFGLAVSDS